MLQTYDQQVCQRSFVRRSYPRTDEFWTMLENDELVGQCALWWEHTPTYQNEHVGLIGHFQAGNDFVAQSLLELACERLAMQGCTFAIAPVDGNAWQRYRVVTEEGTEPPFFLEPDYSIAVMAPLKAQGFEAIAHYCSALSTDLTKTDPRSHRVKERLQKAGVKIRCLDLSTIEIELKKIYELVCISFQHHFLYTPISKADFIAQYQLILPYVNPELVFISEHQDRLVGVLFAVPNWSEVKRGESLQTIILKTIAVLPDRDYAGLGQVLFEHCHMIASQLKYQRAIYALIHDQNPCLNLVHRYASTFRRYAVFAKAL